jgi:hypothetical protein
MAEVCSHVDPAAQVVPSSDGCEDCLRIGVDGSTSASA